MDEGKMRILAAHMLSVSRQPGLFATFEAAMRSAIQLAHSDQLNLLPSAVCEQIDLSWLLSAFCEQCSLSTYITAINLSLSLVQQAACMSARQLESIKLHVSYPTIYVP